MGLLHMQVGGYFAMNLMMPTMLGWVLGGNIGALRTADRVPSCRLGDAPKAFHERDFWRFLRDDSALLAAAHAHWTLVPADAAEQSAHVNSQAIDAAQNGSRHKFGLRIAYPEEAQEILEAGLVVGRGAQADIALDCAQVRRTCLIGRALMYSHLKLGSCWLAPRQGPVQLAQVDEKHAAVRKERDGTYSVTDLASTSGTWLNSRRLAPKQPAQMCPGDVLEFGPRGQASTRFKVKMVHATVWSQCVGAGTSNGSAANTNGSAAATDAEAQLAAA